MRFIAVCVCQLSYTRPIGMNRHHFKVSGNVAHKSDQISAR